MNKEQNKKPGYGLLSMMAMIIGIVIGSGIFIKNQDLIEINGSILLTIISWVIAALMVISILIAFFEIISITEITNEQSNLANWGRHLYGIKFGKVTGYFFTLVYFPIIIAALFLFSGSQFEQTLIATGSFDFKGDNDLAFSCVVTFAALFGGIVLLINSLCSKPGKYFQNFGTALKTIPLFFIIILLFVILCTNTSKINFQVPSGMKKEGNPLLLIFMTMPSMLFAFDGFILAGALSKEAKTEGTFKTAFVISMIFIIVVYILFSVSVFGLSDITQKDTYGTISNVIINVFSSNAAKVLAPMISAIVLISILTGVSGCSIAASKMLSDLSINNSLLDKNGEFINKNKSGVSVSSGLFLTALSIFWFSIAIILDGIVYLITNGAILLSTTGYMSNLVVIGGFTFYSIIMIGGIINRYTNKVEVKKTILFIPAAIFASISTIIITLYFAWTTIIPSKGTFGDLNEKVVFISQLVMFFIFLFYMGIIILVNMMRTNDIEEDVLKLKEKKAFIYYEKTQIIATKNNLNDNK